MDYSLKDSILLYSALVIAGIGLLMLFLIMFFYTPEEKNISDITDDMVGQKIIIIGKISSIKTSKDNSTTFLKVIQECTMDVTIFDNLMNKWNDTMINSTNFKITGKVQEYNGKKGLIADDILNLEG
jgi:DNA polymerase III alpha subunit